MTNDIQAMTTEADGFTATYSPEDNKLRIYAKDRLGDDLYQRVKKAGFKWAPKQQLFVAPKWTPAREDLAVELAGEIEPEEMTLAERAAIKADRLDDIAERRAEQASAFRRAADEISERFASGQPILIGHHSERKALKDQERMQTAQSNAAKAHDSISYWNWRAEGVERFANMKNDPRVRARRIKTLLAELRDMQRNINTAHKALDLWAKLNTPDLISLAVGRMDSAALCISFNTHYALERNEITPERIRENAIAYAQNLADSPKIRRWLDHILNRLAFERDMLGDVPLYTGEITPTIIQMFVREHGADKPKASKGDADSFILECEAPLPLHIGTGRTLEMSADEWRELMQSCGHIPADKKPAKPPILNFESPTGSIVVKSRATYSGASPIEILPVIEITKAEHKKIPNDYKGTRLSPCGEFRVRYGRNIKSEDRSWGAGWVAYYITDQKTHPTPESADFTPPTDEVAE